MNSIVDINKSYFFRRHLRGSLIDCFKAALVVISFILLLIVGTIYTIGLTNGVSFSGVIAELMLLVIAVCMLQVARIYYKTIRKYREYKVTLTEYGITFNGYKNQVKISYEDIQKIVFSPVKSNVGWVEIRYNDNYIRLTITFENMADFLYNLKTILDSKGKSYVYNEEELVFFFRKTSSLDEKWERVYDNIKFPILMSYFCYALTMVIIFLTTFGLNNYLYIIGALIAPFLGYLISEKIISKNVKKRVVEGEYKLRARDVEEENRFVRKYVLVASLVYILLVVLLKSSEFFI